MQQSYRMFSVRQPWADFLIPDDDLFAYLRKVNPGLVARLPKDVENRGYATTWRGDLFIQAAQQADQAAMVGFGLNPRRFVYGAVVGMVRVVDVVTDSPSWWAQPGQKHWQVDDRVRLDNPVRCSGFQGVRAPTPHVLASVLSQLAHQRHPAS